ncbi:MAG: hypothetical protein PHV28_01115 [Kiritimatiellae bacterium]|nr:hypothetical protein [Kiritimatiellia bacterium]
MNKVTSLCLAAITAVSLTGCVGYRNSVAQGNLVLDINTTATYDVIGDAKGTATGATLFGFIPIGGENKGGSIGASGMMMLGPVEQAAIYNAIESVPTADSLMWPRFQVEVANYIVYSEKTVTVKGKAIRFNPSAK